MGEKVVFAEKGHVERVRRIMVKLSSDWVLQAPVLFVLNPDRVPVEVCDLDPGCASCGRDRGLCCMTPLGCWLGKEGSTGAVECGCDSGAVWEGSGTSSELDG